MAPDLPSSRARYHASAVVSAACALSLLALTLALAACGDSSPSPSTAEHSTTTTDLSAIACASDDPDDVGELTGAWSGSEGGVYYIRQVGECVRWFGTELRGIQPGVTGQHGFANVASGRVDGFSIVVEWADVPVGDILNGGGLTFFYDQAKSQLVLTEQRGGGIPSGDTTFTHIETNANPDPSPTRSPG